ncbi:MAG TPA: Lrp/AsnC ligand binding domain-containing protein, partial [Elusimicrobiales bacterium]|nr:Lrp/AsnC ligand binding domain-containing protein [Elusimicrobiales bacterium]
GDMLAFIICKLEAGQERDVLSKIREIPHVKDVYLTFGGWDVVVIAEANTLEKLSSLVIEEIRSVKGIHTTETLVTTTI